MRQFLMIMSVLLLLVSCDDDIKIFKESTLETNPVVRVDSLFEKNILFRSFLWDKLEPMGKRKRANFTGYYDTDKLISLSLELIMPDPDSVKSGKNDNQITIRNSQIRLTWPGDSVFVLFPVDGNKIINQPLTNLNEIVKPDSLLDQIVQAKRLDILTVFQKHYEVSDKRLLKNLKSAISTKQTPIFSSLTGFKNSAKVIKQNLRPLYSLLMTYDTNLSFMNILNAKYGYSFDSFPLPVLHSFFQQAVSAVNTKMADKFFQSHRYPPIKSKEFKLAYFTALQKNSLYLTKNFYKADRDIDNGLIVHTKIMKGIFGKTYGEDDLTPFCVAAFYGDLEIVKFFFAKNPLHFNLNKALACATYNNKIKTVEFLLKNNANPEVMFPEASAVEYARKAFSTTSQLYKLLAKYSKNE